MRQKILLMFALCFCSLTAANAQVANFLISNANNNSAIDNASISIGGMQGSSNAAGFASIVVPHGKYSIVILAEGYTAYSCNVDITSSIDTLRIPLQPSRKEIGTVTVSGSRFQKRVAEEIVSIEVLKPAFIKNAAINKVDEALNKMPGVTVVENQVNIRGGAGWSYGAGSRVMVLVDDMPMLTADAADAKWDFMPIENCEQIEVLKGAASSLYGSSALNGVVNFRTAYAKNQPITKVQVFGGAWGKPQRKQLAWWSNSNLPFFTGAYASHARKIGRTDLVLGSAYYKENSYLLGDATHRIRLNGNVRNQSKKINGLTVGLNFNVQRSNSSTFFLHEADTTLTRLLMPYGGTSPATTTLNFNNGTRANVDPYVTYHNGKGLTQSLRTRYLLTQNLIPEKKQTSIADLLYGEYQLLSKQGANAKPFLQNTNIIAGLMAAYGKVRGELYGNHYSFNYAPYVQVEKKIGKLWLVAGARHENFVVDTYTVKRKMVLRSGLNYEIAKGSNLRASWGQGFRYPTIAERFVYTNFGAASVFPNPALISESGYSAEIGIKQGILAGKWLGYVDAAVYYMQYKDMMEFNFGLNLPDTPVSNVIPFIGFQSRNIGNTWLGGIDLSAFAQRQGKKANHQIMLGYTYLDAQQINADSAILINYSSDRNFLKYRMQHNIKASWDVQVGKWSLASINTINSPMINIDEVFENSKPANTYGVIFDYATSATGQAGAGIASTVRKHRELTNNWILVADLRLSYQINKIYKVATVMKNLGNAEYDLRPALMGAPRSITIQFFAEF